MDLAVQRHGDCVVISLRPTACFYESRAEAAIEDLGKIAEELHLEESNNKKRRMKHLPRSCSESASSLKRDRKYYENGNVFPSAVIDTTVKKLRAYKDNDLTQKLKDEPQKVEKLMQTYLHYG